MAATVAISDRSIEQLNHHQVHDLVKRGHGTDDFCADFGCTERDLEVQIRRLFPHDAEKQLKNIERNDKRQRRQGKCKQQAAATDTAASKPDIELQEPEPTEAAEPTTENVSEATAAEAELAIPEPEVIESAEDRLAILQLQEKEESAEVIRLEKLVKKRRQRNDHYRQELQKERDDLNKLKAQIVAKCDSIRNLDDEAETNNEELVKAQDELDFARVKLEETRQEIVDAKIIWIDVNTNGELTLSDDAQPHFAINDFGYDSMYSQIMGNAVVHTLTGSQIITLARLLAVIINAGDANLRFVFNDEVLRTAYHAVSDSM